MKECLSSSFKAVMLTNILQISGAVLVTGGVMAIYLPVGFIVAGAKSAESRSKASGVAAVS